MVRCLSYLVLGFSILLGSGCRTHADHPAELRSVRLEIEQIQGYLLDTAQVLTYCARMTPDSDLANMALSGVLGIIGEPDPSEKVFAVNLTADDCSDMIIIADSKIAQLDKLKSKYVSIEEKLSKSYSHFAASHSTLHTLKWIGGIGLLVLILGALRFR